MLRIKGESAVPAYAYLGILPESKGGTSETTIDDVQSKTNTLSKSKKGNALQAIPLDENGKSPIMIDVDIEYPALNGERIMAQSVNHTMIISNFDGMTDYVITTNDDLVITREGSILSLRCETTGVKTFKINSRVITMYVVAGNTALKPKIIYPEHLFASMNNNVPIHIESKGQANRAYSITNTNIELQISTDSNFNPSKTFVQKVTRKAYDYGNVFIVNTSAITDNKTYYLRARVTVSTNELGTTTSLFSEAISVTSQSSFRTLTNKALIKRVGNTLFDINQKPGMGLAISGDGNVIAVVNRKSSSTDQIVVNFYKNEKGLYVHKKTLDFNATYDTTGVTKVKIFLNHIGDKTVLVTKHATNGRVFVLVDNNKVVDHSVVTTGLINYNFDIDNVYSSGDLATTIIPATSFHKITRYRLDLNTNFVSPVTPMIEDTIPTEHTSYTRIPVKSTDNDYRVLIMSNGSNMSTLLAYVTNTKEATNDKFTYSNRINLDISGITSAWHNGNQTIMNAIMNNDNSRFYLLTKVDYEVGGFAKGYCVYEFNVEDLNTGAGTIYPSSSSFYVSTNPYIPTGEMCLSPDNRTIYIGVKRYDSATPEYAISRVVDYTHTGYITNIGGISNTEFGYNMVMDTNNSCLAVAELGNATNVGQIYLFS